jgi:hypothetical protein
MDEATPQLEVRSQTLRRAAELLRALGANYLAFSIGLETLQSRLETGRFHLALLGQFKRRKSTLLNAFLGDAILPTGVMPLTTIPNRVRF